MKLKGHITADAIVSTRKDKKILRFSISASYNSTDALDGEQETAFFDCYYWRKEIGFENLKMGALVNVIGKLRLNPFTDEDGRIGATLDFFISEINLLSKSCASTDQVVMML